MKARFSALDGHSGIAYRPGVSTRIPLLLLPGLLNDARLWHHQTEALAGIADERRRLRNELHDELGPTLTGIAFTTDAAVNRLPAQPEAAAELMIIVRSSRRFLRP